MATLKNVDTLFSQAVESKTMPGIVAAAATDKGTLYEGAFGTREIGASTPMTLDTVVWIASMTKAITATAALQLVERGKLGLDRPASRRGAGAGDGAGARGLRRRRPAAAARAQAPDHARAPAHPHGGIRLRDLERRRSRSTRQVTGTPGITTCTNAALTTPLLFDPGDRWEYGINIDWAGKMVEAA